jgi:succinate dehydrogenase / fumarate reductase flavoprotein subunit
MGGIPTNETGEIQDSSQKTVAGLFAVGECAAASFHGFNRLGTNSLLELITMGKFAAERVLEDMKNVSDNLPEADEHFTFSKLSHYLEATGQDNIGKIREALRTLMTDNASIFRTENGLLQTIDALKELKERADGTAISNKSLCMNQELLQRWELDNLLTVAMIIARAALDRKESRGAHYREDFPERKDEFNYHTLISMKKFGEVELGRHEVDMSIFKEEGGFYEKFGMIERKY